MKKIIELNTKKEIVFVRSDLPMMVHGVEHSGASLLSITIATILHAGGEKLCIFTAYPMAKDEFLGEVSNPEDVFYLENFEDLTKANNFQTIIVESGNIELFKKVIAEKELLGNRIVFIKNIETINQPTLEKLQDYDFMVSGDFSTNILQKDFNDLEYKTKIFLSPLSSFIVPVLAKYQAFLQKGTEEKIIIIS